MIHLDDALTAMKDKTRPFSISFVTCSADKKKGGEIIKLDNAVECGLPYKSKQRIGIKQLNNSHHPFAVHIHLITEYNNEKVFW